MSESYIEIQLDHQPIELCKLLKIADLVTGGGEAKIVISEGYVFLNGEVEYQKRKKVYNQDIIEFNGETIQVVIIDNLNIDEVDNSAVDSIPSPPLQHSYTTDIHREKSAKQTQNVANNAVKNTTKETKKAAPSPEVAAKKSKRKPISF